MGTTGISEVSRLAPLFQLWAGVCILCFYGELLNRLVASESRAIIENQLTDFKQNLHGLMSDKTHTMFSSLIDKSLNNYKNSIIHVGKLSFCYCVFILYASSIDGYTFARIKILFCIAAYVIYSSYVMSKQRIRWPFKMWSFMLPALVLLLMFAYPFDRSELEISEQSMATIMLLSLLAAPLLCIARYYWEQYVLTVIKTDIDRIEKSFQAYSLWRALPSNGNLANIKDSVIRKILKEDISVNDKQERVDQYIYQQVEHTFNLLLFKRYIAHSCLNFKRHIDSHKPSIRFYSAVYLLIAFYIFMIITCAINSM